MTFRDASKEFELDCKVRHLSPKTIGNYTKQLRYLENYLSSEFSVLNIEDVKPAHIKSFMAKMDDAGRKPQYINDLLKVFKTFFTYLETEGYIKVSPAKRIRNMKLPKLKLRTFTEKNIHCIFSKVFPVIQICILSLHKVEGIAEPAERFESATFVS